jgi:hypothetical protein
MGDNPTKIHKKHLFKQQANDSSNSQNRLQQQQHKTTTSFQTASPFTTKGAATTGRYVGLLPRLHAAASASSNVWLNYHHHVVVRPEESASVPAGHQQ